MVGILADGRDLAVRFAHKCLQLLFKQLIRGLGSGRRSGSALGTGLCGSTLTAVIAIFSAEIVVAGRTFPLRLGFQTLDGKIDLAIVCADYHDLYVLTFGQMLADIADVGIGYLRNMYHAGLVVIQCDECAEIGDCLYFAL